MVLSVLLWKISLFCGGVIFAEIIFLKRGDFKIATNSKETLSCQCRFVGGHMRCVLCSFMRKKFTSTSFLAFLFSNTDIDYFCVFFRLTFGKSFSRNVILF